MNGRGWTPSEVRRRYGACPPRAYEGRHTRTDDWERQLRDFLRRRSTLVAVVLVWLLLTWVSGWVDHLGLIDKLREAWNE